jgi:hypothetical protein
MWVLPNVLCCERNYDNCNHGYRSHLHPEIVSESGFVAGLRIHLWSPPSRIIDPRALAEFVRSRPSRDALL